MSTRAQLVALVIVATTALVASCSGTPAVPATTPPPSLTTSAALPHSGAPKVNNPLPASVLTTDPCQSGLTTDQLKTILGTAPQGEPNQAAGIGPSCSWTNSDKGSHVAVAWDRQSHDGLSGWYENTKPQAVKWQELPAIQGFPAVAHVTPSGGAPDEFCQISIGITDEATADVTIGLGPAKKGKVDPCQVTAQVADMVVTNLRQKANS
ncbi:DUF3558 domain-containing protein [Amycolatopsis saalfeldensis]|uniref:DUF3558 domain-containing protein n=1 Tax=Amycolatopsis saalfeldensis TaxID=394193 RepID=A0A1H8YPM8_9PSEU|nr:DUF3558 domain-containing protein [Amycolatopsis saalfeldensis]SEP54175.1 Protein of unknown function [Amycolatopsis saalfeldensis]